MFYCHKQLHLLDSSSVDPWLWIYRLSQWSYHMLLVNVVSIDTIASSVRRFGWRDQCWFFYGMPTSKVTETFSLVMLAVSFQEPSTVRLDTFYNIHSHTGFGEFIVALFIRVELAIHHSSKLLRPVKLSVWTPATHQYIIFISWMIKLDRV